MFIQNFTIKNKALGYEGLRINMKKIALKRQFKINGTDQLI